MLLAHRPAGADLDDLLQDVALALTKKVGTLRDRTKLRPWLRSIAVNVAGTARRQGRARGGGTTVVKVIPLEEITSPAAGPEEQAVSREQSARILALAHELPPEYREPLLLRSLHSLSQKRIAEILQLPETTIETRLTRARRMLRRKWDLATAPQSHTPSEESGAEPSSVVPQSLTSLQTERTEPR